MQSWISRTACLGRQPLEGGVVLETRSQIDIVDMILHVFILLYYTFIYICKLVSTLHMYASASVGVRVVPSRYCVAA